MNSIQLNYQLLAVATEDLNNLKRLAISTDIASLLVTNRVWINTGARIQRSTAPIKRFIRTKQKEL